MPLPSNDQPWPLVGTSAAVDAKLAEWGAWYSGDPDRLQTAYSGAIAPNAYVNGTRASQLRTGVQGKLARFWWGRPVADLNKRHDQLHVPVAADLAQASADLLFSEDPTVTFGDDPNADALANVRARWQTMYGDGLVTTWAEGAEVGAGLGGCYLRCSWDKTVSDTTFTTIIQPDVFVPEFRYGRLLAGTWWQEVERGDSGVVVRHLERHELGANGIGIILHGLYSGTDTALGRAVPLQEHRATEHLASLVDEQGAISTGSRGLAVTYVPNQRPQRRWRADPAGRYLGRSDYDGVEGLMDALDEVYASWMRDVRLGRARLVVPEQYLQTPGLGLGSQLPGGAPRPGAGGFFDLDQEVYSPLPGYQPSMKDGVAPIEQVQFQIRFAEHQATADSLLSQILRTAGYSAQTFGEAGDSAATATEVVSRERRSYMTRDRKVRNWRPALAEHIEKLLRTDQAVFAGPGLPEGVAVKVDFADAVQADPLQLAQTAQALRTAQAASTATLVAAVHPDWTPQQVTDEVALIAAETAAANPPLADPTLALPLGAE